ncbi:hypothetical protein HZP70_14375 [Elizabethkingia anophelis]|nr:hypothetical protein [Elizabethkingia anophelis]QQM28650.1 hypothetical protein JCR23_04220 [Elizabethkingia sp. M8]MCT3682300.1 hypothetical protein [Elizabethkingia anophelis]MCT3703964.1 hypothetical protein [Elizabethkingia anophelis]MCT3771431.1 hypothetical protein [Elizabethkingia anophelis]
MATKSYLLIFLMFLGTFMYPEQLSVTASQKMDCHTTEKSSEGCCQHENEHNENCCDQNSGHANKSCKDSCKSCQTCSGYVNNIILEPIEAPLHNSFIKDTSVFSYSFPVIPNRTFNIWQPPKLI